MEGEGGAGEAEVQPQGARSKPARGSSRSGSPRSGGRTRTPRVLLTHHTAQQMEVSQLRVNLSQTEKIQSHLVQELALRDRQLQSACAAASWAEGHLKNLSTSLEESLRLYRAASEDQRSTPTRNRRPASTPRSDAFATGPRAAGDKVQQAMGDLCVAATRLDDKVRDLGQLAQRFDSDRKMRELQARVRALESTVASRDAEIRILAEENARLAKAPRTRPAPTDPSAPIACRPEVIRMPSCAAHSVNAEHWPVRSVGVQTVPAEDTPKVGTGLPTPGSPPTMPYSARRTRSPGGSPRMGYRGYSNGR